MICLLPCDPQERIWHERSSAAFGGAGDLQRLKRNLNSKVEKKDLHGEDFHFESFTQRRKFTLAQTVELSGHAEGSDTLHPLRIEFKFFNLTIILTLLCRCTLH